MVSRIPDTQLKRFVIDAGLVPRAELSMAEAVAQRDGASLVDTLLARGALSEDEVRRVSSYVLGIPFVSLAARQIDFETLSLIPEPVARAHNVIAYRAGEAGVEVALLDPADLSALDFLRAAHGAKLMVRLTDETSMGSALRQYQKALKRTFGDIIMRELARYASTPVHEAIARVVDTLLRHAVAQGASDIHVEPLGDDTLVRYRIGGVLRDAMALPGNATAPIVARIKELARVPQGALGAHDGRFRMEMDGQAVSFRVSVLPVYAGEKAVMRLLRESRAGFTLEGLGFHGEGLEQVHALTCRTQGLALIAGPAHSGKSTLLYTLLDLLNTPAVSIATVEEPIEYQMPRVAQVQVDRERGLAPDEAVRAALRQDPDVVMVGALNDAETAGRLVSAALSGRFVLAGVDAPSAGAAIAELVRQGVDPLLLAPALSVVVSTRLARRLAAGSVPYTLSHAEQQELSRHADLERVLTALRDERRVPADATWHSIPFYRPQAEASGDGYEGFIGIEEVRPVTSAQRELIVRGASASELDAAFARTAGLGVREDALYKAALGLTSLEEALRVSGS